VQLNDVKEDNAMKIKAIVGLTLGTTLAAALAGCGAETSAPAPETTTRVQESVTLATIPASEASRSNGIHAWKLVRVGASDVETRGVDTEGRVITTLSATAQTFLKMAHDDFESHPLAEGDVAYDWWCAGTIAAAAVSCFGAGVSCTPGPQAAACIPLGAACVASAGAAYLSCG
jgi:hypothetical protein